MRVAVLAAVLVLGAALAVEGKQAKNVFWALNAGGGEVVTDTGVVFSSDEDDKTQAVPAGISAHTPRVIVGARPDELMLYQTERYALKSFSYEAKQPTDGDYVLVLKFAEVYFQELSKKVFDVQINGLTAIKGLDIFARAGFATAYDVHVPFTVRGSEIEMAGEKAALNGHILITFSKQLYDNPKVCAMAIIRGDSDAAKELLPLPEIPTEEKKADADEVDDEAKTEHISKREQELRKRRGSKRKEDPYQSSSSTMSLILIGGALLVGTFVLNKVLRGL